MQTPVKTWRVHNLDLGLDEDESVLRARAAEVVGVDTTCIRGFRIARQSLDARRAVAVTAQLATVGRELELAEPNLLAH